MKLKNPYICEIYLSKDLYILDGSAHLDQIFGSSINSLLNTSLFDSLNFCSDSRKAIYNTIEVLGLGDYPGPIVLKDLSKDDRDEYQYLSSYLETFNDGFRLVMVDHTSQYYDRVELNKAYSALKDANKNKDKFISLIAHDLRAPIANLSVVFEEISNGELILDEELTELLSVSSKSALSLIEEVLVWAQNSDYKFSFKKEEFCLSSSIEEVVNFLGPIALKKSVSVSNLVDQKVTLKSDNQAIMTVIRNLLNNSLKFTPKGGEISIKGSAEEKFYVISIQDNGVGMTKDSVHNIMSNQAVSTKGTSGEEGSGLGLNFCQMLVKGLGGRFIVSSEVGKGTLIRIEIPISS